jgi:hypothetical protein
MAFNLIAKLGLKDDFSSPLRRIQRQVERSQKAIDAMNKSNELAARSAQKFANQSNNVTRSLSGIARGTGTVTKGLNSIKAGFLGVAGAIGGAVASKKIFDSTIVESAQYERSTGLIGAMMGDFEKAKVLIKEIDKMAVSSPLLNSQDMFAAASTLIPMTKDIKQLKKLYDISERLLILNNKENLDGSTYALRELLMGKDVTSLAERFNIAKSDLHRIKKLPLTDALVELDKVLNKLGASRKTVDIIGNDTLGIFNQIKESMSVTFRQMGEPALKRIRDFLGLANNQLQNGRLEGFKKVGARMLDNVAAGFISAATGIGKWIEQIQNNQEFQKKTTLFGQVKWIISDIYKRFTDWLNDGGRDKIAKTASDVIQILTASLEASMEAIAPVALKVGSAIGKGVLDGFNEAVKDSWLLKLLSGTEGQVELAKKKAIEIVFKNAWKRFGPEKTGDKPLPKKNGGMNYVPYNGYEASLHRGEMILTRSEADEYRKNGGRGGNTYQFNVTINGSGYTRRDADQLFEYFVKRIEESGNAGA